MKPNALRRKLCRMLYGFGIAYLAFVLSKGNGSWLSLGMGLLLIIDGAINGWGGD